MKKIVSLIVLSLLTGACGPDDKKETPPSLTFSQEETLKLRSRLLALYSNNMIYGLSNDGHFVFDYTAQSCRQ